MIILLLLWAQLSGRFLDGGQELAPDQQALRALAEELARDAEAPVTNIDLKNLTGRPIDAILVRCSDTTGPVRSWSYTRRVGPYPKERTLMHKKSSADSFLLDSITIVRGEEETQHELNFTCEPGSRILIVVDRRGKVQVTQDK